jgi:hypothetical protein
LPAAHAAHCESDAVVHVGAEAHCAIAAQAEQARFDPVEQAVLSYCPAAHAPEHGTHVSATPSTR